MAFLTRRDAVRTLGLSLAASTVVPPGMAQKKVAATDKLTVACIGVGAQGLRVLLDLLRLDEVRVVAVCDANRGSMDYLEWAPNELRDKVRKVLQDESWGNLHTGPAAGREVAQHVVNAFYTREQGRTSGCNAYEDFRELLAKEHDLDAVVISTPDHWHAIIAIAAMRAGKHVYSQKPMAHSVWEARAMERVAAETRRATQVSIFNSAIPESHQVQELLQSGLIGPVRRVDIWTSRPAAFWRQGLVTPTVADSIPAGLNWDLWLGPAADRPFSKQYLPFRWRAWYDFGCGALGDMGEYGLDTISRAVGLGVPSQIESSSTEVFPASYPVASNLHFHYPATAARPAVQLNWFDGGLRPERPAELSLSDSMSTSGEGVLYSGEKGKLMTAFMGQNPRLLSADGKISLPLPSSALASTVPFVRERPELGESATAANAEHYRDWIRACRGGPPARASYAFERPIVEGLLLGNIAVRTGELLEWDAASYRFLRGSSLAAGLLKPQSRSPWAISS